jgi:cold-inducible RNA-binding protein
MDKYKIYVGNLSFNTTQEELESEFSQYGDIEEVRLISDRETGRSKGFAFISYKTEDAMEAALKKNGEEIDGRTLRINKAEDRSASRAPRNHSQY